MCCKSSLPGGSRGKSRAHTGTHTGDLNQWRTPITGASREIQVVKDPCPKAFCQYCNYRTCEQDSWFLSSWTGIILFFKFSKKQKSWRQLWGRELRQWELDSTLIRTAASQAWVYRLGLFFFFWKGFLRRWVWEEFVCSQFWAGCINMWTWELNLISVSGRPWKFDSFYRAFPIIKALHRKTKSVPFHLFPHLQDSLENLCN